MNNKTKRVTIFFVLLLASLTIVLPVTREGRHESLKTGVLIVLIMVLGVLNLRNLNRQLELEKNKGVKLHEQNMNSSRLISELDFNTRREISVWLHGDVQRQLMSIARRLRDAGHGDLASGISELNDQTVRAMAHRLHPPQLDISLELALSDLCHGQAELQLSENLHLQSFTNSEFVVLPTELRIAIYRIVEEGITNALKKPNTQKIAVAVTALNNCIEISVQDDGDRLKDNWQGSLGFSLIAIFVERFGGSWSISNDENGVILRATLNQELTSSTDYIPRKYPNLSRSQVGESQ
ncbi:unannotated protein [freshwater metagenome]|uniref:Unannotated protein n=1 Tax=freshwater metagenome TaxID=449393 RepID=A0A6J6HWM7_9ZZZZ|nr:hypothetical protein [Actinomycetota bacterium]